MKNYFDTLSVLLLFSIFVVSAGPQKTRAAETRRCALESCHGLNLKCGFNAPDMCTQMYSIGDFCRQYAGCELSGDTCKLIKNPVLDKCINCVNACPKKIRERMPIAKRNAGLRSKN